MNSRNQPWPCLQGSCFLKIQLFAFFQESCLIGHDWEGETNMWNGGLPGWAEVSALGGGGRMKWDLSYHWSDKEEACLCKWYWQLQSHQLKQISTGSAIMKFIWKVSVQIHMLLNHHSLNHAYQGSMYGPWASCGGGRKAREEESFVGRTTAL